MKDLRSTQDRVNDVIIKQMCMTFNKDKMKQLIEIYIMSNNITEDIQECKQMILDVKDK